MAYRISPFSTHSASLFKYDFCTVVQQQLTRFQLA